MQWTDITNPNDSAAVSALWVSPEAAWLFFETNAEDASVEGLPLYEIRYRPDVASGDCGEDIALWAGNDVEAATALRTMLGGLNLHA